MDTRGTLQKTPYAVQTRDNAARGKPECHQKPSQYCFTKDQKKRRRRGAAKRVGGQTNCQSHGVFKQRNADFNSAFSHLQNKTTN